MNKKNIIISAILIVIVGAGMFYAGMKYDKSTLVKQGLLRGANGGASQNANGGRQFGQGGQGGPRTGGAGFINGSIVSKDDQSITVKSQDGSSKIIFFSDSTVIGKAAAGSVSDLNAGEQVLVNGKANTDGSIAAQNIQIRPAMPDNTPPQ